MWPGIFYDIAGEVIQVMLRKNCVIPGIVLVMLLGCLLFIDTAVQNNSKVKAQELERVNYSEAMALLLGEITTYARKYNNNFLVIGNNGFGLLLPDVLTNEKKDVVVRAVDGMLTESYFFGWELQDDNKTPSTTRKEIEPVLEILKAAHKPVFNIDYCKKAENIEASYRLNMGKGIISLAANSRQLDDIPVYPQQINKENEENIVNLRQAKNLLILLNPQNFSDKANYLAALANSNYDVLIIDLIFANKPLTAKEVKSLKTKKNGAKRVVMAYMSVGEAEDYRAYWQASWSQSLPQWVAEKNPDWPGNYKVKYWDEKWKRILFGQADSYLDMILTAGFDGVFLDLLDAYQYFEMKEAN